MNVSAGTLAELDYDADGDTLTITAVNSPSASSGTRFLEAPARSPTRRRTYVGADQFTYTISDGYPGGTATCTANVTVRLGKATSAFNYVSATGGTVNLRGYGIPGKSYDVQRSSDADFSTILPYWRALPLRQTESSYYTDTAAPSPSFYRFAVH